MSDTPDLVAPQAILLDLDGVLADIEGRRALVSASELAALAALRPVAVVTGCPRRLAESVLTRHGHLPFVTVLVAAEDAPGKPDPAPVRLALRRLLVERAWMLGDNPSDVEAAVAAGVVAFGVQPHGIGAESHAQRLLAAGAVRLVAGVGELAILLAGSRRDGA